MSENDLDARLRALEEGGPNKQSNRRRPSPLAAIAGIVGIIAAIGLLYILLRGTPEETFQTSQPDEFQLEGDGFGGFEPFPETASEPEPVPQPDPDHALLDLIESLQAEIAALRDRPPEEMDTSEQDAAMAEMLAQLEALERANADAQAEFQRALRDRDQQLAQLQADLDLARLQPGTGDPQPTGMSEEELALLELQRRQQEAAAFQEARDASPMIAYSGSGTSGLGEVADRVLDAGTDFVLNGARPAQVTQAQVIVNPGNTVPQGTLIQAALETAVDSSTPGQVRAITSENVYAYDGSRILIPRGSRLIGRYDSSVEIAQERITIGWDRIILPTQQTVELSAFGGDELGRSGVTGHVDTRFRQRFGSAALISLITAGANYGSAQIEDRELRRSSSDMGSAFQSATQTALNDYLSLGPIIRVEQGATVTVMVDRDLEIF